MWVKGTEGREIWYTRYKSTFVYRQMFKKNRYLYLAYVFPIMSRFVSLHCQDCCNNDETKSQIFRKGANKTSCRKLHVLSRRILVKSWLCPLPVYEQDKAASWKNPTSSITTSLICSLAVPLVPDRWSLHGGWT